MPACKINFIPNGPADKYSEFTSGKSIAEPQLPVNGPVLGGDKSFYYESCYLIQRFSAPLPIFPSNYLNYVIAQLQQPIGLSRKPYCYSNFFEYIILKKRVVSELFLCYMSWRHGCHLLQIEESFDKPTSMKSIQ